MDFWSRTKSMLGIAARQLLGTSAPLNPSRSELDVAPYSCRRESEREHLRGLPNAQWDPARPTGVLLSDQIEFYIDNFKLIEPVVDRKKIRAAGYELSVGTRYSKGGKTYWLKDEPGQDSLVLNPFEVVVIQIYERLNMPEFMIARWNVQVGKAYDGLLWVGAAQVDPGFKGYLCCPIYNLSDNPVTLTLKQSIAVIDFVTTTPPSEASRKTAFDALGRKRLLFEDYGADRLQSALTTKAQERLDKVDRTIEDLRTNLNTSIGELRATVNTSIGVILTALGALVTALALFVGQQTEPARKFSPPLLVAMAALAVSFAAMVAATVKRFSLRVAYFVAAVLAIAGFLVWYGNTYKGGTNATTPTPAKITPSPH